MSKKENTNQNCNQINKVVFFATGNIHKFNEVCQILSGYGISVAMLRMKGDEIQSDDLKEIAKKSVTNAFRLSGLPIFVEDAGLFIDALNGFPGPYAAFVYKTIHNKGILDLMKTTKTRQAKFRSVIAYLDQTLSEPEYFEGESKGEITLREFKQKGRSPFGFDPIFRPEESKKSFAEMTIEEKNNFSHRAKAIQKFAEWHKRNGSPKK